MKLCIYWLIDCMLAHMRPCKYIPVTTSQLQVLHS